MRQRKQILRFFTAHSQSPSPNINHDTKTNEEETEATGNPKNWYKILPGHMK